MKFSRMEKLPGSGGSVGIAPVASAGVPDSISGWGVLVFLSCLTSSLKSSLLFQYYIYLYHISAFSPFVDVCTDIRETASLRCQKVLRQFSSVQRSPETHRTEKFVHRPIPFCPMQQESSSFCVPRWRLE